MRRFDATLDSLSRTITFVLCMVMIIPFIAIARMAYTSGDARMLIAPVIIIIILGLLVLYRVRGYQLDNESLTVLRAVRPPVIPLSSIRSVEVVTAKELGAGLRTFGNGGFMGYTGRFYYKNIGHANLYVTDRSKQLLITLNDDRKIIISPDDPPAFMKTFVDLRKGRKA